MNKIIKIHHILTLLFFAVSYLGILHHELWLDEAHHWLLARDSTSFSNLITNTRYEGHPILWNILLYGISRFTSNPIWMQLLHITISTTAVYIFLKKAPLSLLLKIMFVFGYFMFFEYNLLSRNYALGVLFLFLACATYKYRREKFVLLAFLLALTANSHAIFFIIAVSLLSIVILEYFQEYGFKMDKKIGLGLVIFIIGAGIAVFQILPPSDTGFFNRVDEIDVIQKISKSLITLFKGLIILPDFRSISFWNTNLIIALSKPLAIALSVSAFIFPCFLFYKNNRTLLYTYSAILGGILFFYITQIFSARSFGLYFMIILSALWIDDYYVLKKNKLNSIVSVPVLRKIKTVLLYSIFGIHFFSGLVAYGIDYKYPFTNAQKVVAFLQDHRLSHKLIATKACDGTALSSYLERPIFFLRFEQYQSYCIWNREDSGLSKPFQKEEAIASLEQLLQEQEESIIFISFDSVFEFENNGNWIDINKKIKYKLLAQFEESILNKGKYYVYEVTKSN